MHPLLLYAIKVIICSGILVGYYWLGLRNKVFHHYNRFYLLTVVVLSLTLPLIKINFWQHQQNTTTVFKLLQAVNTDHETLDEIVLTSNTNVVNWEQVSFYLYAAIVAVLLLFFLKTLATIYFIYCRHEKASAEDITLIQTEAKGTPFSFFQLIFWNIHIDLQSPTGKRILQHEIAHVQQKHSYDKIFINLVLIACWCNPFFWLIRKELNMIHEFTADQQAVKDQDTTAFAAMILQATYPQHRFDITNQFFYSPIKRRLMMLTKNNHTKAGYISRIMVLPLAALVFVAFTFKAKTFSPPPFKGKKITVVIDAGHGGKDFGATDGNGTYEKDLSLAIAQKIKALNSNSDIDIVLTRETDVYQTPPEKADFINSKQADLAISVHIDAIDKDSANFRSGISFWVSKDESNNSQGSKVLASSIIQSFSDGQIALPLLSPFPLQKNKGVWILKATNCPIVLMEAGFITNKNDLAFLKTEAGKEAIAIKILRGIENYAENLEEKKVFIRTDTTLETKINFKAKKINEKENQISGSVQGSFKVANEKNILIIINGKKASFTNLQNLTINAREGIVYCENNKAAINEYGEQAANGVIIFKEAVIENISKNTNEFNIYVDEITIIGLEKSLSYQVGSSSEQIDVDKALMLFDGKVATRKEMNNKMATIGGNYHIKWLKPAEAMAKYGEQAKYGACETTFSNETKAKPDKEAGVLITAPSDPEPLYIVDGTEITDKTKIKNILAEQVDKVNVLKGSAAIAAYGTKGVNGVVEIFTKNQTDTGVQKKEGNSNSQNKDLVFVKVEQEAEFPGGNSAWARYMQKINEDFKPSSKTPSGKYQVMTRFIVYKDGSIGDIVAETKPGYGLEEQAINVIKKGPKWNPARQNGHNVNSYYHQPVTYVVK